MKELIKTDLLRFFKSKMFWILLIVATALPFFSALLSRFIYDVVDLDLSLETINPTTVISNSASFSGNFGFILMILGGILLDRDRKSGMLRNKLICGKTRTQVYFSQFIAITVFYLGLITYSTLITLGIDAVFFKIMNAYQGMAGDILLVILIRLLDLIMASAVATFISLVIQKSTALIEVIAIIGLSLLLSFVLLIFVFGNPEEALSLLNEIDGNNTTMLVVSIVFDILIAAGATIWGFLAFQNTEIK